MSLRKAIRERTYKERAQPHSRRKFGLLEKHKDYIVRARVYHQKQQTLQKLKEKAAFRNPDEFNFKMIRSKCVNGVHRQWNESSIKTKEKFTMKTKRPTDKKKSGTLNWKLYSLENQSSNKPSFYVKDREWEDEELEQTDMYVPLQDKIQKKGMKWKLRGDEFVYSTSRPIYI